MKKPILITVVLTNLVVGTAFYFLGSERSKRALQDSLPTHTSLASPSPVVEDAKREAEPVSPDPDPTVTSSSPSPNPPEAAAAGRGIRSRVSALLEKIETMDAKEVLASLKKFRHQPGSPDKVMAQQMLLARYGEIDPETALTYVETLSGEDYEMSGLTVMNSWTAIDPEAAAAHYSENLDDFGVLDDHQRVMAGAVAVEWSRKDPEAALEWADELPTEVRGEAYGRIVADLVAQDPAKALAVRDTMDEDFERTEMTQTIVDQWAYEDPQAAASWVMENTTGDEQGKAAGSLMKAWMTGDPVAASTWLGNMDDGATKDSAIVTLTESRAANGDPEAALVWSNTIQDQSLRDQTFRQTAAKWLKSDPTAAQAYLRSNTTANVQ